MVQKRKLFYLFSDSNYHSRAFPSNKNKTFHPNI